MRNIFINNYRQTVRKATVIDQTEDLYHLNISQDSGLDTPEGSYAVKEIASALNSFSDEYRIPFNMFVAGYKYNEIAEKMNLPLGTVKSRIFFARKRLREQLKDYGDWITPIVWYLWFIGYSSSSDSSWKELLSFICWYRDAAWHLFFCKNIFIIRIFIINLH